MTSDELKIFKQSILDDVRVMMQTTGQVTQYIGARYVPLFADPLGWSANNEYEPLTIVTNQGNSYTSRQFVPKGIELTNEQFWVETGNFNAQIEQYRKEVEELKKKADYNYNTVVSYGLDKTGTRDNATIFQSIDANVGLKEGTYLISTPCTISCDILIPKGAIIVANADVTFTGTINAGAYKVFEGSGAIVMHGTVRPEWFGAVNDGIVDSTEAFKKTVAALPNGGIIELMPCENNTTVTDKPSSYKISDSVIIESSGISIYGNQAVIEYDNTVTPLLFDINSNSYSEDVVLKDMTVYAAHPSKIGTCINVENVSRVTIENFDIFNFSTGVHTNNSVNLLLNAVYVYLDSAKQSEKCYGFHIMGTNASLRLDECHSIDLSDAMNNYGFYYESDIRKDFILSRCEFNKAEIGFYINSATNHSQNFDCFIDHCVFDWCKECIKVNNIGTSLQLNITGCWLLGGNDSASLMECNTSNNIVITNCQFAALNTNQDTLGLVCNAVQGVSIANNTFVNISKPIIISSSSKCVNVCGNVLSADNTLIGGKQPTSYVTGIECDGTGIIVTNNVGRGTESKYTKGVDYPSATNTTGVVCNNAIPCEEYNVGSAVATGNLTL